MPQYSEVAQTFSEALSLTQPPVAFSKDGMRAAHVVNGPTYAHAITTTSDLIAALPKKSGA